MFIHWQRESPLILHISFSMKAMNYQDMIKIKHYNYRKGTHGGFKLTPDAFPIYTSHNPE